MQEIITKLGQRSQSLSKKEKESFCLNSLTEQLITQDLAEDERILQRTLKKAVLLGIRQMTAKRKKE